MPICTIESLDHEGRGVTRLEGKAIFVEGALPGEEVEFEIIRTRPSYALARLTHVHTASAQRVAPRCRYFGHCGGCSLQHLDPLAQAAAKQRVLEDALWHVGKVRPEVIYPVIQGPAWGYRSRARIGVRLVPSRGGVLIGFHERKSSFIADMSSCEILPPHVSNLLPALHELIAALSAPDRIPQIEISVGDETTVLVLRNLLPITETDAVRLTAFGQTWGVQMWLQPGGPDSIRAVHPVGGVGLSYGLPEFGVRLDFRATDFTQVNVPINRQLIRRSMQLLEPRSGERIADLFCGLGNFSLPITRLGAYVIGIEGSDELVARAAQNARSNGLGEQTEFHAANLFEASEDSLAILGPLDKMLIDPPREGAIAVVKAISAQQRPSRIVYVSCNPATLARDAAVLVREKGYTLKGAGIANMFPQTSHVESIALFERE